jgi:hypothetical protein
VEELLCALKQQRNKLANRALVYQNFLAPVSRLPSEILLEIFRLVVLHRPWYHQRCLEDRKKLRIYKPHGKIKPGLSRYGPLFDVQLQLSHICSHWRNLVVNEKQLWTKVYLTDCLPDWFASENAVELTELQRLDSLLRLGLSRSGTLPLDVEFGSPRWYDSPMRTLISSARRWKTARMGFPEEGSTLLSWLLSGNLHILERLTLVKPSDDRLFSSTDIFKHAPNLRHVDINEMELNDVNLPWPQLHSYTALVFPYNDMHQVLRLCTNLKKAQFDGCTWNEHDSWSNPPFDLTSYTTNISELAIDMYGELPLERHNSTLAIFDPMTCPNLSRVTFKHQASLKIDFRPKLKIFFRSFVMMADRSGCAKKLTYVRIECLTVPEMALTDLFHQTTNLKELHVNLKSSLDRAITPTMMEEMSVPGSGKEVHSKSRSKSILLPNLVLLRLSSMFPNDATDGFFLDSFLDMLMSRQFHPGYDIPPTSPLSASLRIAGLCIPGGDRGDHIRNRISRLQEAGAVLNVVDLTGS